MCIVFFFSSLACWNSFNVNVYLVLIYLFVDLFIYLFILTSELLSCFFLCASLCHFSSCFSSSSFIVVYLCSLFVSDPHKVYPPHTSSYILMSSFSLCFSLFFTFSQQSLNLPASSFFSHVISQFNFSL